MALSEYEQEVLADLEKQFGDTEDELAEKIDETPGIRRLEFDARRVAIGALLLLLGIVALVVGVSVEHPLIGLGGFLVMFAGIWHTITRNKKEDSGEI